MEIRTVSQVCQWLGKTGFENYTERFKDEGIDGKALMKVTDDRIEYLLSIINHYGVEEKPSNRIKRIFKRELEVWRAEIEYEKNKQRIKKNKVDTTPNRTTLPNMKNAAAQRTQILIEYIEYTYNVRCIILSQDQHNENLGIQIQFSGVKQNVEDAHNDLESLFTTVTTKIFNDEETDKKAISWSQTIYSDLDINIIQKTFDKLKLFTVWEKTDFLAGYYVVHYFTKSGAFYVSEDHIKRIMYNHIAYVKDIIVSDFGNISKSFREKLEQLITQKAKEQQQKKTFSIIYWMYPGQTELKISFFGQHLLVKRASTQLKHLINQHQLIPITTELTLTQRNCLLDNYVHQLKNIELEYNDYDVKIHLRENRLYVPDHLKSKILQRITNLIDSQHPITFQCIGSNYIITNDEKLQMEIIARQFKCEIYKIEYQSNIQLVTLPKSTNTYTLSSVPKFIINKSKEFHSSLSILEKLSISNSTIELHFAHDSTAPTTDFNILSVITNEATQNGQLTDSMVDNENDSRRTMEICHVLPYWSTVKLDKNNLSFKNSIENFIFNSLRDVSILSANTVNTIAFCTNEWENYSPRIRLAEEIINELKIQLKKDQFSHFHWRILFVFNRNQIELYNQFSHIISSTKTNNNDYEQFFYPISSVTINFTTSDGNVAKCHQAIRTYLCKTKFKTIEIRHAFDSDIWNQHLINRFYSYCLERFVLPKNDLTDRSLVLVGSVSNINEIEQKYKLMDTIVRQKMALPAPVLRKLQLDQNHQGPKKQTFVSVPDAFNIVISYCTGDKKLADSLTDRLIDEGYSVYADCSDQPRSVIEPKLKKSDLIVILFSENYGTDEHCLVQLRLAQSVGKRLLPVFLKSALLQSDWIQYISVLELYHELFEEDVQFELDENYDLEYDRLLVEMLQHTKPGVIGQKYSVSQAIANEDQQLQDGYFASKPLIQLTAEQIEQRRKTYDEKVKQLMEREQSSNDDIEYSIKAAQKAIEDCENGYNPDDADAISEQSHRDVYTYNVREITEVDDYLAAFLLCIKGWIDKASNGNPAVCNIPPFTLTGDFNDAIFPVTIPNKKAWWRINRLTSFDHTLDTHYFYPVVPIIGSWANQCESLYYLQGCIARDVRFHRTEEANGYTNFTTEIKKGSTGWDITQDAVLLCAYKYRKNRKITEKSPLWDRIVKRTIELTESINEKKIDPKSNILQGKIGHELKKPKEIQKRNQLDDPNNEYWKTKRLSSAREAFLQQKLKNILEFEEFCRQSTTN
ncbi:unnamed protein product [Rotaria socialis]|uniref:SAM domain-containing protein n=1 Tax=Rotaria socialis TaxID=392032 RepID=A0A818JK30_9BILA|nr:unnamed protein product [Rotaria socialis]CAF4845069.1 unnamed protein product [Rotaria socialis]